MAQKRVALVTGSSSGVGAACVEQPGRGPAGQCELFPQCRGRGGGGARCRAAGAEVLLQQADVSEDGLAVRSLPGVEARFGRLDALVNNAGTTKFVAHSDLEGLTAEDFHHIYGVNTVEALGG